MTNKTAALKKASQLIRAARYPLLICHVDPDGDAIGSLMGLSLALQQAEWQPTAACADPISPDFDYIPGAAAIIQEPGTAFDLVVVLDCSDRERAGEMLQQPALENTPLLNIDHHLTNTHFGTVNLVDPHAASTAEIVLQLLRHMGLPINAQTATALLSGIVTDTRGFRTCNVTAEVMQAATHLMRAGASLPYVAYHGLDRRSTAAIRLWGAALSQVQVRNRVIWASIPLGMRREAGFTDSGDASLVSFLIGDKDADAAAVFVEQEEGQVEIGLRAVHGFDVAKVALQFGGGGHAAAAGCQVTGSLEQVRMRVLEALWAELARQRRSMRDEA